MTFYVSLLRCRYVDSYVWDDTTVQSFLEDSKSAINSSVYQTLQTIFSNQNEKAIP